MMISEQRKRYEDEIAEIERKIALNERKFCVEIFGIEDDDEALGVDFYSNSTSWFNEVADSKKALKKRAILLHRVLKGSLGPDDLIVGHTYRARNPKEILFVGFNDRTIVWTNGIKLRYDGPAVKMGQHYPTKTVEDFLGWAKMDVTETSMEDRLGSERKKSAVGS